MSEVVAEAESGIGSDSERSSSEFEQSRSSSGSESSGVEIGTEWADRTPRSSLGLLQEITDKIENTPVGDRDVQCKIQLCIEWRINEERTT